MTGELLDRKISFYERETKMCKLFSFKETSHNCYIDHKFVNNNEIIIRVNHNGIWNLNTGKQILEKLLMKFKLNKVGWSEECKVSNYSIDNNCWYTFPKMTEHTFVFNYKKLNFLVLNSYDFSHYINECNF